MANSTTRRGWRRSRPGKLAAAALAAAALLALPAAGAAQQLGSSNPDEAGDGLIERIVVKVNGDIITKSEIERRQVEILRQRGAQLTSDADLIRALQEITPEIISSAVDELLLIQRGRELGYTMTDEQFEEIIENLRIENDLTTDQAFTEALDAEGMTLQSLREMFERQMLISQVQQVEVMNKVRLTEVEAREYYEQNLDRFTAPATVTLREILIRVPESGGATLSVTADDQARVEAEEARQRVLAGEDFEIVAVAVSDAASKANGGLIGPLELGVLSEDLIEVLAALDVGEVTEPIRTTAGYQVLRLEERTSPEPAAFEEVDDEIANNVFNDRRRAEYTKYLDELRAGADIEWKWLDFKEFYDQYAETRAARLMDGGG